MTDANTFQLVSLAKLHFSKTDAQAERRKMFDKAGLAELAESIKAHGVLQPIVTRRLNGGFEVVAGERRALAAKQAGLDTVPAVVRDMTDEQVLEVQLVENLQREGLHELVEAEGYEQLLAKHKHTVDQIVDKVGKSKGYVYARLKLLALCPEARKAFHSNKISASIALLLARIPVHDLQRRALKEITASTWEHQEGMSFRQARDHVARDYMLRLDQAPFATDDATLCPKAGVCGSCPKRTGNQPGLFGDVKSADVCTDPVCFGQKKEAHLERLAERAKETGKVVIAGEAARKIAPHGAGEHSSLNGYVRLADRCYHDSKNRTYQAIVGKDVAVSYLEDARNGEIVAVAKDSDVKAALKKAGVRDSYSSGGNDTYRKEQAARQKKARELTTYRGAVYAAVREKLPPTLGQVDLAAIGELLWDSLGFESCKEIVRVNGWLDKAGKPLEAYNIEIRKRLDAMKPADLSRFLFDCLVSRELKANGYGSNDDDNLQVLVKRTRVDAGKIKRELAAAAPKPKAKGKKAAKKK